jgi:hypothetical protein
MEYLATEVGFLIPICTPWDVALEVGAAGRLTREGATNSAAT